MKYRSRQRIKKQLAKKLGKTETNASRSNFKLNLTQVALRDERARLA